VKLDVVVPTYNRSNLLRRTVASLLQAPVPAGLDVTIVVVDNNSKDDTEKVVREIQSLASLPVEYVKEARQGLSYARNAGINSGNAELIGFIDDDEEIHGNWYQVILREFGDSAVEFIGGPYLPNWEIPAPDWLPPGYHAAIGVVLPKSRSTFGGVFNGNLMGGNAVIRRSAFEKVGLYNTRLGRSGKGLLSDEDAEFYRRLREAELHGMYVPDLLIYHFIPIARLTRNYHRRWCFWRAVSQGVSDRTCKQQVRYFLWIPRYMIGRALKGLLFWPRNMLIACKPGVAFAGELASWDLFGFVYGRFFIRIEKYYGKQ